MRGDTHRVGQREDSVGWEAPLLFATSHLRKHPTPLPLAPPASAPARLLAHRHRQPSIDQVFHRAPQVLAGAAGAWRVALPHRVEPCVLYQQHRIGAHRLVKLANLGGAECM